MKPLFIAVTAAFLFGIQSCPAAPRPNIIFILADDLGYGDTGVFFQNLRRENADRSQPWLLTPHIDAMAAEGVQLRQHYCPAPVCAPSRASLLLGVHQGHSNVRDNQFDKALEDNHTLGTVLRGAGYATAAIGKWGLQGVGKPDEWTAFPTKRGFDFYHGYVRHNDGHFHYPFEDKKQVWENDQEISAGLAGCYTTDLFTARAKKWIADEHTAAPGKPFFLYLAFDTPHAKLQLPPGAFPEGGGLRGGLQWLGKPGAMINTASGTPDSYIHPDYANATWDHDHDPRTPEQPWPEVYKRYATDVRRIDECIGDLLQSLKDLSIENDTLVVFTSDNGPSRESYLPAAYEPTFFHSFGPFDGIKRDVWEGGIRVGAVVRWPNTIPAHKVSELPCQSQDWMPTFAELAGVAVPARCDGTSLVPTLTGLGVQKPTRVYVEYAQNEKTPPYAGFEAAHRGRVRKQMQAIRFGDFIGVRYNIQAHGDPFEIYNIVTDPKQAKNLAAEQPALQEQMHDAVLGMRRPDPGAPRPYDGELIPEAKRVEAKPGVSWSAFNKSAPWLARLEDVAPVSSGTSGGIGTVNGPEGAALLFSGYIEVPVDGEYTFFLPANTLALLRIHEACVIDNAFAAAPAAAVQGAVLLKKGKHPFRLSWQSSSTAPSLEMSGPGLERQAVPAALLSHE